MKILLGGCFYTATYDNGLLYLKALTELGHTVIPWDTRLNPKKIPPAAKDADASIILKGWRAEGKVNPHAVNPEKLPGFTVNMWPDCLDHFPEAHKLLEKYDRVFTTEKPTLEFCEWNPGRFDEQIHYDMKLEKKWDTVYIGSMNSQRKAQWVAAVKPRVVCGNGWDQVFQGANSPLYGLDFTATINRAKVAYVFFKMPWGPMPKTFECPQITFSLIEKVEGVPDIYKNLTKKVCFTSPKEAIELRDFYLENEQERMKVWKREKELTAKYTYQRTCEQMLKAIK